MRFRGKLKIWHEDRGFGFIEPADGGQDIFVHASALPRGGSPLRLGDLLSFELELNAEGKKRAARVERPSVQTQGSMTTAGNTAARRPSVRPAARSSSLGMLGRLVGLAVVLALGFAAYREFQRRLPVSEPAIPLLAAPDEAAPGPSSFRCDGRQHCSQMSSCAEARFFLVHCPNTKMDGDRDGVPCEDQLCR